MRYAEGEVSKERARALRRQARDVWALTWHDPFCLAGSTRWFRNPEMASVISNEYGQSIIVKLEAP